MAEHTKSGGTDKPNQLNESFTLELLQLITICDFNHSVQAIHKQKSDQKSHSFSYMDIARNDFKKHV